MKKTLATGIRETRTVTPSHKQTGGKSSGEVNPTPLLVFGSLPEKLHCNIAPVVHSFELDHGTSLICACRR